MLLTIDSPKTVERIREDLPRATAAHAFGVLGVHDLKSKIRERGIECSCEALIFEVCNPAQAKRALEAMPEIAAALPCRIAVYPLPDGRTRLATLRPTALLGLFGDDALTPVAVDVEREIEAIMRDAAA